MKQKKPIPKSKGDSAIVRANDAAIAGWRDRLKEEMSKQHLSQRKLAGLSNLGSTSIRHLLTEAETYSAETMRRIANALNVPVAYMVAGVSGVVETEQDGAEHRRIRLLKIHLPTEDHEKAPAGDHGVVPVAIAGLPERLYAMKVTDTAMVPFGMNEAPEPSTILLKNDVVIWSPEASPSPGEIAVLKLQGSAVCCRLLAQAEGGKWQAVPLNSSFARQSVSASQILGAVLQVHRSLA